MLISGILNCSTVATMAATMVLKSVYLMTVPFNVTSLPAQSNQPLHHHLSSDFFVEVVEVGTSIKAIT
jgi:hypothetical protein